jgi:PAS domain S-box-containing protein
MSGSEGPLDAISVVLPGLIVLSARDAIIGETLGGTVAVWNRAAEELYGYRAAEMVGQRAERLYPPGSSAEETATLRRVAAGHRLGEFVCERIRCDGTPVRVCVRAVPIIDGVGVTIGVATTSWEVAESDGPAGVVLAGRVAHDLRTPLNAIIGFTGTLLMRLPGPLNEEQELQLGLVQTSAEQLLERINQLSCPDEG